MWTPQKDLLRYLPQSGWKLLEVEDRRQDFNNLGVYEVWHLESEWPPFQRAFAWWINDPHDAQASSRDSNFHTLVIAVGECSCPRRFEFFANRWKRQLPSLRASLRQLHECLPAPS